jgi:hypothetical protein
LNILADDSFEMNGIFEDPASLWHDSEAVKNPWNP